MGLADVYRHLGVPQPTRLWGRSSRNEAANTVVVQIDALELRAASAAEEQRGIAKVHETFPGAPRSEGRSQMLEDVAYAYSQQSWVRAILANARDDGELGSGWRLLPEIGQVVELDPDLGTFKIAFFRPSGRLA